MTNRYELLLESIAATNQIIVGIFAVVLLAIVTWYALGWTPARIARPARIVLVLWGFAIYGYLLLSPFVPVFSNRP